MNAKTAEKLLAVVAEIKPIAYKYAPACGETPEDLEADMMVELIERVEADENFLEQKSAYIRRAAQLVALKKMDKFTVEKKHFSEMPLVAEADGDEAEVLGLAEVLPDTAKDPEQIVCDRESLAEITAELEGSNENDLTITVKALEGKGTKAIAAEMKISAPAVSQRKAKIGERIENLAATNDSKFVANRPRHNHVSKICPEAQDPNRFKVYFKSGKLIAVENEEHTLATFYAPAA